MSFSRPTGLPYEPHLDGLRGLAVLLVVVFHAFPDSLPGGYVGVDVFFVLSGFLITQLILKERENGTFTYRAFLGRRVRRLAPAFLLVSLCSILFAWQGLFPESLLENAKALGASLLLSANWYFYANTDYFAADSSANLFLHIWSLSIEEQFYLVFPLVIIVTPRRLLLVTLMTLGAASYVAAILTLAFARPEEAFFATHARVWEILIGCLLAAALPMTLRFLKNRPRMAGALRRAVLPGVLLIIASAALFSETTPVPGPPLLVPILGAIPALLWRKISPEGPGAWGAGLMLESRPAVALGKISYSLYLWHWPLLVMTRSMIADPEDWHLLVAVMLSVGLAILTYRTVENPVRRRQTFAAPLRLGAVIAASWVIVSTFALAAIRLEGAPHRIPDTAIGALAAKSDRDGAPLRCAPLPPSHPLYRDELWQDRALCQAGAAAPDAPVLVLWGDSHAGAMQKAAADAAMATGTRLLTLTRGGCPPLAGMGWSRMSAEERRQCEAHNEAAMRLIEGIGPAAVLMVGHWDIYAPQPNGRPGKIAIAGGPWRPANLPDEPGEAFFKSLRYTAGRITPHTDLRLLLDVPTHGFPVPEAIAQARILPFLPAPRFTTRRDQERARRTYVPMMMTLESEGLLSVYDPLDVLCPVRECIVDIEGAPLYFDANHLSNTGAAFLLDQMPALLAVPDRAERPLPGDEEGPDAPARGGGQD